MPLYPIRIEDVVMPSDRNIKDRSHRVARRRRLESALSLLYEEDDIEWFAERRPLRERGKRLPNE